MEQHKDTLFAIAKQLLEITKELPHDEGEMYLTVCVGNDFVNFTNAGFEKIKDFQHLNFKNI